MACYTLCFSTLSARDSPADSRKKHRLADQPQLNYKSDLNDYNDRSVCARSYACVRACFHLRFTPRGSKYLVFLCYVVWQLFSAAVFGCVAQGDKKSKTFELIRCFIL